MYNKDSQMLANKKWKENNPEKWAEINRAEAKKNYEKNRELKGKKSLDRYYFKKEINRLTIMIEALY